MVKKNANLTKLKKLKKLEALLQKKYDQILNKKDKAARAYNRLHIEFVGYKEKSTPVQIQAFKKKIDTAFIKHKELGLKLDIIKNKLQIISDNISNTLNDVNYLKAKTISVQYIISKYTEPNTGWKFTGPYDTVPNGVRVLIYNDEYFDYPPTKTDNKKEIRQIVKVLLSNININAKFKVGYSSSGFTSRSYDGDYYVIFKSDKNYRFTK